MPVRLLRCAVERRGAPGPTLVDENDIALAAYRVQLRHEWGELRRRLARTARQDEQRIGLRRQRVGRQYADEQLDLASAGRSTVLRHLERPALRRLRQARQPALR